VLVIADHEFPNHDGGQLPFGPDGDLSVGVGDGGSEGDPHTMARARRLLGKLLRVSPRPAGAYSILAGNPLAGERGRCTEIRAG
jgi:glucose/arabinose dehydrogenase